MKNKLLLAILLVLGITQTYSQTTYIVTNTNNSGAGSLRQQVINAVAGDIIRFSPGLIASGNATVVLSSAITIDKALTINGIYNANYSLSISGNNAARIFNLVSTTNLVTLDSLVMINGEATDGGAIQTNNTSPLTLTNCRLEYNDCSSRGGAIYAQSVLTLTNCTLLGNSVAAVDSDTYGGAIYASSTLTLTNCTLNGNDNDSEGDNSSSYGGAIYAGSALSLTGCTLFNNSTSSYGLNSPTYGGAIYASSTVTLANCTLNDNSVYSPYATTNTYGGAIYCSSNSPSIITDCSFNSNNVLSNNNSYGGAICAENTLTLMNCELIENEAYSNSTTLPSRGGAIYAGSDLTLTKCTFTDNTSAGSASTSSGGAVHVYGNVTLTNCILNSNYCTAAGSSINAFGIYLTNCTVNNNNSSSSTSGSSIYGSTSPFITNSTIVNNSSAIRSASNVTLRNSIVAFNGTGEQIRNTSGSQQTVNASNSYVSGRNLTGQGTGNFTGSESILFVNATTDYHLQQSSPMVNAGNNSYLPADTYDVDGDGNTTEQLPIDLDGSNRVANGTVDIGAYERCDAVSGTDVQMACDSYTWINNVTYTSSNNTATYTISGGAASGCDSIVTLNLTIQDNQVPVPTMASLTDITAQCSVTSLTAPTATDNCAGTITATHNVILPITTQGTTVVTWTYNDGHGNTTAQTQNVIIDDITAPVPTNSNLPTYTAPCSVTFLNSPTATDNCAGTITVTNDATLPITTVGTTVVTWTYDDGHGNTTTQTQNVVVTSPALAISIVSGSGNSICSGTSVTFTATAADGGSPPAYQWKVNGSNVGTNSATYTTTTLNNSDVVTCVVTSNLSCINGTTATSNSITFTVTPSPATSVSIVSNVGSSICAGNSVTFTATITNGGTPVYQWQVNGSNVGNNSPTFTTTTLANGQTVTCLMTSSLICASPAIAVSNAITMTVGSNATPTINITSNPTGATICSGVSVTFTANITNGGASPTYQWKLNGNNVGTNTSTYVTATLATGDAVTCVLTSSSSCPTVTTVTSNSISKTVNQSVTPTITITSNPAMPVCEHGEVTFTATITNGGSNPSYQWKKDNQNYGIGGPTYATTLWSNGNAFKCVLTSNALCVTSTQITSNIIITNEITPDAAVTVSGNTITATQSGANYQWYNCSTQAPISGANEQSFTATQSGSYYVVVSAGSCSDQSVCQTINWNSLDELSADGFILYPNPAKDYFVLDLPENTAMHLELYDISGRKVMEGTVEGSAQQIDIHSLVNGSYQLVLHTGNKEYFAKVIVNH